jgi:glycosyltransferase involved in cell wall biosynthesis
LNPRCQDPLPYHIMTLDRVVQQSAKFDLVHFHTDYCHFPLSKNLQLPSVTTLHGRLDIPDLQPLFRHFVDSPVISISYSQRTPLAGANWIGNVYHGLSPKAYKPQFGPGSYLAFLGRISPEKRPDRAIQIAIQSRMKLKIAAKIDKVDQDYFNGKIKPMLSNPLVEFIGEIGDHEKSEFLGNAYAYLFPIDWPEPFGLSMIEAMACGTPTIAFRCGSVPEIIGDKITGFIVDDLASAVACVPRITEIDRRTCRKTFEQRFTDSRMAADYVSLYNRLLQDFSETGFLDTQRKPPALLQ